MYQANRRKSVALGISLFLFFFFSGNDAWGSGEQEEFTRLFGEAFYFTEADRFYPVSLWSQEGWEENLQDEEEVGEEWEEEMPPLEERFQGIVSDILTPSEVGYWRIGRIGTVPGGRLSVWRLAVFPIVEEEVILDDNIYLQETSAEADVISSTTLGAFADLYFGGLDRKHYLRFGYKANFQEFCGSGKTDFIEQFSGAALNLDFNHLYTNLQYRFERRFDPLAIQFYDESGLNRLEDTGKLDRTINTVDFLAGFRISKLFFEFNHQFLHERYHRGIYKYGDRDEPDLALLAGWKYWETLEFYVKGMYGERNYQHRNRIPRIPDSDHVVLGGGVRGEPTDRLAVNLFVGWRRDHFEREGTTTDPTRKDRDVEAELGLAYRLMENDLLEAVYLRTSEFAARGGSSNFQILDHAAFTWTHHLDPQISFKGGIFGEQARPSRDEEAYRWGLGLGFQWRINEYLDLNVDYSHRRRIAKVTDGDFEQNIASLGVSLKM